MRALTVLSALLVASSVTAAPIVLPAAVDAAGNAILAIPVVSLNANGTVNSGGGGGGGSTSVTATAAAPTYVEGSATNPLSTDLNASLRVLSKTFDGSGTGITSTPLNGKQRLDVSLGAGAVPGNATPGYTDVIGGTDGTLARQLLTDTGGRLIVNINGAMASKTQDGAGTAITSTTFAGGKQRLDVTLAAAVAPGSASPAFMDQMGGTDGTLARAFLTDTSGRLAVNVNGTTIKAASTASVATDTALVVVNRDPVSSNVRDGAGVAITSTTFASNSKQRLDVSLAAGVIPGAAFPAYMDQVGGNDGTLARAFLTDTSGRLAVNVNGGVAVTGSASASFTQGIGAASANSINTYEGGSGAWGSVATPSASVQTFQGVSGGVAVPITGSIGNSGFASTVADGANITLGSKSPAAIGLTGVGTGTATEILRAIDRDTLLPLSTNTAGTYIGNVVLADGADVTLGTKGDTVAAVGAASATVNALLKAIDRDTLLPLATQANTISIGAVGQSGTWSVTSALPAVTTGGATPYHLISAAGTNSTLISTGAHTLYSLTVTGLNSTAAYVRVYDTATNPTCSSATGAMHTYPVIGSATAQGGMIVPLPAQGEAYINGLGFCITGGSADTDNSAAVAGVIVNASFK